MTFVNPLPYFYSCMTRAFRLALLPLQQSNGPLPSLIGAHFSCQHICCQIRGRCVPRVEIWPGIGDGSQNLRVTAATESQFQGKLLRFCPVSVRHTRCHFELPPSFYVCNSRYTIEMLTLSRRWIHLGTPIGEPMGWVYLSGALVTNQQRE
jgi:hypothetical protein